MPVLFDQLFPSWFAGVAFAAIGIGALVPAAIMSIAAANLWTRNIYKEYLQPRRHPAAGGHSRPSSPRWWSSSARCCSSSLIDPQFSIDLQLIGGVIILQTLPAVAIGLYTRWLHRWALIAGWVAGMGYGLYLLYHIPNPAAGRAHFGGSALALDKLTLLGWHPFAGSQLQIYVGFVALLLNLLVAVVLTPVLRARRVAEGADATAPADYHADEGAADLRPVAAPVRRGRRREQAGADRATAQRPMRPVHRRGRRGADTVSRRIATPSSEVANVYRLRSP